MTIEETRTARTAGKLPGLAHLFFLVLSCAAFALTISVIGATFGGAVAASFVLAVWVSSELLIRRRVSNNVWFYTFLIGRMLFVFAVGVIASLLFAEILPGSEKIPLSPYSLIRTVHLHIYFVLAFSFFSSILCIAVVRVHWAAGIFFLADIVILFIGASSVL